MGVGKRVECPFVRIIIIVIVRATFCVDQ